MPAMRWVDSASGGRDALCIGCARHTLMPHTSDCPELAELIRRAKEDNAMPEEFDERTPLGKLTLRRQDAFDAEYRGRRDDEGNCIGCYVPRGVLHHLNCPEAARIRNAQFAAVDPARPGSDQTGVVAATPGEGMRNLVNWELQRALNKTQPIIEAAYQRVVAGPSDASRDILNVRKGTAQRQLMGILGPGSAELVATKAQLESVTAERDDLQRKNEDYSQRLSAANGRVRELEAELAALRPPAPEPKEKAVARAIGATVTGWRPLV